MKVRNFRASDTEYSSYSVCAAAAGMSVSAWLRRAANEAAEDQKAIEARLAAEREKRDLMRDTMVGGWM